MPCRRDILLASAGAFSGGLTTTYIQGNSDSETRSIVFNGQIQSEGDVVEKAVSPPEDRWLTGYTIHHTQLLESSVEYEFKAWVGENPKSAVGNGANNFSVTDDADFFIETGGVVESDKVAGASKSVTFQEPGFYWPESKDLHLLWFHGGGPDDLTLHGAIYYQPV